MPDCGPTLDLIRLLLAHERHASRSVVDRCKILRHDRQTQVPVDRDLNVEELSNVHWNVRNLRAADLDRIKKAVNNLELAAAADCACQAAPRHRLDAETFRSLL